MKEEHIGHLVIIGVGLIGGSLARALRQAGMVGRITGVGRNPAHLSRALELGVVDNAGTDIRLAVRDADMVLICVPMGAYAPVLTQLADHLPRQCIISDVGSTKQYAIDMARAHLSGGQMARFVPAHPIAGTEHSGVEASFAELFKKRLCILTPATETGPEAIQAIEAMWKAAGSTVMRMDAGEHDDFLAAVSHLPHMLAYALVNAVRKAENDSHDPFRFAAGGFRDFTRIASSPPEMWRDIALSNRKALLDKLGALQEELDRLKKALETGDGECLLADFSRARQARNNWLADHGDAL